jgi:acyl-CoA thioesterase FadM
MTVAEIPGYIDTRMREMVLDAWKNGQECAFRLSNQGTDYIYELIPGDRTLNIGVRTRTLNIERVPFELEIRR